MNLQQFFDSATFTLSYVAFDTHTKDAVIIDPVLNYSPIQSSLSYESVDQISEFCRVNELNIKMIIETHAHADHLSGARILRKRLGIDVPVGISRQITEVQKAFKEIFDFESVATDGSQFDMLFDDEQQVQAGSLSFKVMHTPGHTPACCAYLFYDRLFTGDTLFVPDSGTGRCDFPGGNAAQLYHSVIERIYQLPNQIKTYTGHDYLLGGRPLEFHSTIGEQKENNVHLRMGVTEEEFLEFRNNRDKELAPPKLIYQSIQYNINGGAFLETHSDGRAFFKIPVANG